MPDPGRPSRSPTSHRVDLGDVTVLVDIAGRRGLRVNASALAVWQHCDGRRTLDEITHDLAAAFDVPAVAIAADVEGAVAQLARDGLLDTGARPSAERCDDTLQLEHLDGRRWVVPAPSPCQRQVDQLGWTETVAVPAAGSMVGVRVVDAHLADLVRSSFTTAADGALARPAAPAALSLLADSRHGVFHGHRWCGATEATAGAAIDVLGRRLAALAPTPAGWVRLDAPIARGPRGAVVLAGHGASARFLALRRRGWEVAPGPVLVRWGADGGSVASPLLAPDGQVAGLGGDRLLGVVVAGPELVVGDPALGVQLAVAHLLPAPGEDVVAAVDALAVFASRAPVLRCPRPQLVEVLARLEATGGVAPPPM